MKKKKILVVGAGLAGLVAAYELSKHSVFEVEVHEKALQIGGRVQSRMIGSQSIDLGGFIVYPWYTNFRNYVDELGLTDELKSLPLSDIYFLLGNQSEARNAENISLNFVDFLKLFTGLFPAPLFDHDPTEPRLDAYSGQTVEDYIVSLKLEREKFYLDVFDTFLQGYCYGPVGQQKMSMMAATFYQNQIHGDVHASSYFPGGTGQLVEILANQIQKRGGKIILNSEVIESRDKNVHFRSGKSLQVDAILFTGPQSSCAYTDFVTATVRLADTPTIHDTKAWGAYFYQEQTALDYPILSAVNLSVLYGKELSGCLNLNVKCRKKYMQDEFRRALHEQCARLFPENEIVKIEHAIHWQQAMPVVQEDFVAEIKERQGENAHFFAGDYMGCPSMETAVSTAKKAVEHIGEFFD